MLKLSDFLETESMGAIIQKREKLRRREAFREYQAARYSRLDRGWTSAATSANWEIRQSLRTLRARARDAVRNNSHFKKFLGMMRRNVVGPSGIQIQARSKDSKGNLNRRLNKFIENVFYDWGRKETCSVSGKLSWIDCQNLFITTLARDGEVLIQKVKADNKFGFSLKFIDVNYLDETYNDVLPNGNRVIMSVEVNNDEKPVAYYLTTPSTDYGLPHNQTRKRIRVSADDFIHAFLCFEDESQIRGITWFHTALVDAKHLQGYKEGVITSAEAAAYNMGFFFKQADENEEFDEDENSDIPEINVAPLTFHEIPEGYDFKQFDPKQPTQNHSQFYKSILADLAIGLEVNYFSLAGDMEAVNLSTARLGLNEERDIYKMLQNFMTEHFLNEVFNSWLQMAYLTSLLNITATELYGLRNPLWRGRGWAYMNPVDEVKANQEGLATNQMTLTNVLAERGEDLIEHFETIKNEKDLAKEYGIELNYSAQPTQQPMENQPQN